MKCPTCGRCDLYVALEMANDFRTKHQPEILKDNRFRLAYVIYQYWTYAYEVAGSVLFPVWEKTIYGGPPTDVSYDTNPFSIRPDLYLTLDATTMSFLKVSADGIPSGSFKPGPGPYQYGDTIGGDAGYDTTKLPVYSIQTSDITYNAYIVIDYNKDAPITANITNGISTRNCDQSSGLKTVCSAVSLTLDDEFKEVSALLTDSRLVGDWDLINAPYYDIPFSLLPSSGTAGARCRSLMYPFQQRSVSVADNSYGADWAVPINPRDWVAQNNDTFDPTCVTESPHYYLKAKDSSGKCAGDLDIHLQPTGTDRTENEFCRLVEFYKPNPITNRVKNLATWTPRKYNIEATIQVPQGQWKQAIRSSCPNFYNISRNYLGDKTGVFFYTNSTETLTVELIVTVFGDTSSCNTEDANIF